jgi:ABC-2 type transport system permease protein
MLMDIEGNADEPIGEIKIAAYSNTKNSQESIGAEAFLSSLDEADAIEIRKYKSYEACQKAVDSGEEDVAIIFTSPLKIDVIEGKDILKNRATLLISEGFSREYSTMLIAMRNSTEVLPETVQSAKVAVVTDAAAESEIRKYTEIESAGVDRSMLDYYAVAMVIMIAFIGNGISGATDFFNGRRTGVLSRTCATPLRRSEIITGFIGARVLQSALQAVCVMVPAMLFFGVNYADKWQNNILLLAFFILLGGAVSSICACIGILIKFDPYMPIMAIMWVMLLLSGAFWTEVNIPHLSEFLLPRIAQQAAFDLTVFGRHGQILICMAACVAVIVIGSVFSSIFLKRKGAKV